MRAKPAPKPTPRDTGNERALVGFLLHDSEAFSRETAGAGLTGEAFADPTARRIFESFEALRAESAPCELSTIIKRAGVSTREAGELIDGACGLGSVAWHAQQLVAAAMRRRAVELIEANGATPEGLRLALQSIEASLPRASGAAAVVSLADLAREPFDNSEVLIGGENCRYLERGAVLLLSAPAGVGKSHVSGQCAVEWAQGLTAFGLAPVRPLRCLMVQAENPPNDARAIARVMTRDLSADGLARVHENTRHVWLPGITGDDFLSRLADLLRRWPADLVFIDPLLAFSPGDLTKPEIVQSFCRQGLSRLAVDNKVGLFVSHHVPKPSAARDPSKMGAYDFQYGATGNADLAANWPRAALSIQPLARGEFLLRATKRRPPWKDAAGAQVWEIGIRHTEAGSWETFKADPEAVRTGRPPAPALATFKDAALRVARASCPCSKTSLADAFWHEVTGGRGRGRELVEMLIADKALVAEVGHGRGAPVVVKIGEGCA